MMILMQHITANEIVGASVATHRERVKLSQAQLADALAAKLGKVKIDPATISRLEKGARPTTVDELFALSQIFRVPVESLLPVTGPIGDLVSQLESEWGHWRAEEEEAQKQLERARFHMENTKYLHDAALTLRRYQLTGATVGVVEALEAIIRLEHSPTGSLIPVNINVNQILEDLGIPKEVITKAVEKVSAGTEKFNPIEALDVIASEFFGEKSRYASGVDIPPVALLSKNAFLTSKGEIKGYIRRKLDQIEWDDNDE